NCADGDRLIVSRGMAFICGYGDVVASRARHKKYFESGDYSTKLPPRRASTTDALCTKQVLMTVWADVKHRYSHGFAAPPLWLERPETR
ncbi:MAG: hypothetical protein ACRD5Z_15410, partial [Bryobacteraceae bacterium]